MPVEDPNELERVDREIRINERKQRAAEKGGREMHLWEAEDSPSEESESFRERMNDFENAPITCNFQQLLDRGVELPPAEVMSDAELSAKLTEVIDQLAQMHVFLSQTNHLSDRELYVHLWEESLREGVPDMPFDEHSAWHIDILGGCSEEDLHLQLKYYSNEEDRRYWRERFPEDEIPPHEDPPYDRDRHLPKHEF